MSETAELARKYLQEKEIPVVFESLMTSLMYHKPDDPIDFMLRALTAIKSDPSQKIAWDTFIDTPPPPLQPPTRSGSAARRLANGRLSASNNDSLRRTPPPKPIESSTASPAPANLTPIAEATPLPHIPIVILLGGPGGRKSTLAKKVAQQMEGEGVMHISVPAAVRLALQKYQHLPEWQDAVLKYEAGQRIPDHLMLNVVKAQLAKKGESKLVILDGYPRTLQQVAEFEREVKSPEMAIILDFDEETLRKDLEERDISEPVINSRLLDYKNNTLPAAKYYDDRLLLQLIAGEQEQEAVIEQFKECINQVLNTPVRAATTAELPEESEVVNVEKLVSSEIPMVLVVGAPGSRKTEYCQLLINRYDGFIHINMGKLMSQKSEQDTDDAKEIADYLSRGEVIPDKFCNETLFNELRQYPNSWGFILEGYPRNITQAEEFDRQVDRIDMVLLIDCTENFCLDNLKERLGDNSEVTMNRIANFKQHTLPMLKYYDEKNKLKVVEGDRDLQVVFQDVTQLLDGVFIPPESADGKSLSSSKNAEN